ncbi:MAG: SAM-dependent methyltransferase, partial [Wenzhouxiangellaceae bacterium]
FVTAPEHGRLFALALARQLDHAARALGPDWSVLELGPGSGALARDVLLQLEHKPAQYLLLEPSAPLREVQHETLAELPDDLLARVEWIAAPPKGKFSGVIVANEVIDALPVERFRIGAAGIEQSRVAVTDGRFDWTMAPARGRLLAAVEHLIADLAEPPGPGYVSEVCVDLAEWLATVTEPLERGLVLLVDYGYPRREYYHPDRNAGTLVCHYRHRAHFDPFVWPGLTDISAFVDFTAVAEAAEQAGLEVAGFTNQAGFVLGSGVSDRLERVSDDRERMRLTGELKRLVLPGEMGEKFKIMALAREFECPPDAFVFSDQLGRL